MSELKPLNPTEQDALVKQIGLTLMRAAPEEWRHVTAEYRATGRYSELIAEVRSTDGNLRTWSPPQEVANLFARLRAGMYREGRGSWSNARYQLDHPSSYNLDFDRNEPAWQTPPPPQAYLDEMRFFPRTDENVPDWLRRRLQQAPQPPRAFRTARVFDGAGPGGRPSVNRPPVADDDRDLLLSYLDRAPVAVVGRGFDADVLNPDAPQVVPVAFQTDGHWIWPAAVGYYLRAYGVPPEPELVERAKAQDFVLPEVTEESRVAAAANLGAPAAPQGTALPVAEPPEPIAETPAEVGATVAVALPDEPEPGGRAGVEETADLGDGQSEPVEYGQEGPPYRVRFEEDGPVIDDRYRRESYVEGMDLFAPASYEREANDTQAWSPFSEEEPEPARTGEAAEVEAAPAGEPVREDPAEPVADVPSPAPDEVTAEFEVDQELYDRGRAEHDDEPFGGPVAPPADERDRHDLRELHDRHDRHDFEERAEEPPTQFVEAPPAPHAEQDADRFAAEEADRFADQDQFTDPEPEPDRFAAQEADEFADQSRDRFADEPDRFAAQEQDRFADQAPDPAPSRFAAQDPPFADRDRQDQFTTEDPDRFAAPASDQFAAQDSDRFAAPVPDQFAAQEPDRFAAPVPDQFAAQEPDRFATRSPDQFADRDQFAAPAPDQFTGSASDQFAAPASDQFSTTAPDQFTGPASDQFATQSPDRFAEVAPEPTSTPAPAPTPAQPFREATPTPPPPPVAVEPRQVTPEEERELAGIRRALDELDVPPAAYRFGGEPTDRTWLLRTEGQDWEVSWFDHGPTNPVRFDRVEDAAAYLVGKLVLTHRRAPRPNPLPPPPPPMPPQQRPRPPMNNGFREEPPRRPGPPPVPRPQVEPPAQPAAAQQPEGKSARSWPINPMNGEPPLTLFRHKKMVELPAGMEIDRFGDGAGNLVYAAGTPFPQRSLVPSWVNRPYRVYRLRRPVEVLTGVAVPWFEQPGGGTAYLLPKAVDDLIADGVLVEVANQEAPLH
ncbi:glycohydrolase toxin TNT-related protein [Saccharothrix xinjiangensis]|uniref:Glycohydrolase toxin TNT-related protein n=1 Tax=Saccharothrix xinjiangensis TaxID=204798 RepID=A0ABV9Y826_9PSEU